MASRLSRIFLTQPGRVLLNRRFYAIPPNPPRTEEEKRARISDDPTKRTRLDKIQEEVNTIMEHHFTDEDKILVPEESDVSVLSGVPEEHIKTRHARIFVPSKSSTQSGTHNTRTWRLELDNRERWENPLMGWVGTADPLSNTHLDFSSAEQAIAYCEKMGYEYHVEPRRVVNLRPKSYSDNFSWNKRTRRSTK